MLHLSCIFEIYIFIELIKEKQPNKIQTGIELVNFVSFLSLEFLILNLSAAVYLIESTGLDFKMSQLFLSLVLSDCIVDHRKLFGQSQTGSTDLCLRFNVCRFNSKWINLVSVLFSKKWHYSSFYFILYFETLFCVKNDSCKKKTTV